MLLLPTWTIVHSRIWKAQIAVPGPPLPRRHLRRARQRPVRPPGDAARVRRRRVRRRRARGPRRDRRRSRSSSSGSRAAAATGSLLAADAPRARRGSRLRSRLVRRSRPRPPSARSHAFERARSTRRGLGRSTTATTGCSDYRGLPRVLLRAGASPSRTRPSRSRTASRWGLETTPETLIARPAAGCASATAEAIRGAAPRVRCPVARGPRRRRTRSCRPRAARALAEADGRQRSSSLEGAGHAAARARPGARSTSCSATSSRAQPPDAAAPVDAASLAAAPRALRLARRSGSGTRGATSRSPTSCAAACRASRSTGSPRTRSRACSRRAARRSTRRAPSSPASRRTSTREAGEHDLHAFQAIRRMDEILCANFMLFHDVVRDDALRPLDRRRGVGARPLPAREPGAEDARRSRG